MTASVHTSETFARYIEKRVAERHLTYMDAILTFCADRSIEPDDIVPLLSDKIKGELLNEGTALHLLKRSDTTLF